MSKRDIEELEDILVANHYGRRSGKYFMSHTVVIGDAGEHWILYPKTTGTEASLQKLFRTDFDIHIGPIMGEAIAYADTRVNI